MVEILLATYNGEKFIQDQLESLINQTYNDFIVTIRDDGSTDNTMSIIERYVDKYPDIFRIINDDLQCGSAASNFCELTRVSTGDYLMFCDQDDYWFPNKVEVTLKKMVELETARGKETPILVFTDYIVADSSLIPVANDNSQIEKYNLDLPHLLVQNYVTGCLSMINRKLANMIGDYSSQILMHDWWMALIASAFGIVDHVSVATMFYRQHDNNVVGSINVKSLKYILSKITDPSIKNSFVLYYNQASLLLDRFETISKDDNLKTVLDFIDIGNQKHKIKRIYKLLNGRYLKSDLFRIIGQIILV